MASYKPVIAAQRVLDVLAAVNRLGASASISEIHHLIGIDKSTIVRMLETLIDAGYVIRDPGRGNYHPTGKTLSLSYAYDRHSTVSRIIGNDLLDFRQQIGWPSDIALFDRDAMLVIKSSGRDVPFSFIRPSGFRAPMFLTSLGLAYLAYCPEQERVDFIAIAVNNPAATYDLARKPDRLAAKLKKIQQQGYATMDDNYSRLMYESKFSSIGVPIMNKERVFGSINVIYLRSALTEEAAKNSLLAPLQNVAKKMAGKLARSLNA